MRNIRIAASLAALQAILVSPALAQGGYVWDYYRYLDADPFQSALVLQYGVPETDDILFTAECVIGAGGTYVDVTLDADIGSYVSGQTADVQFVSSGFSRVLTGTVIQEFIWGVTLRVETNDPLWAAIRDSSVLYYNLTGVPARELNLRGSAAPTSEFINDCAAGRLTPADYAGPAAPPPPQPPAGGGKGTLSCASLGSIRSVDGGAPANITFVNDTEGYRVVMWIDFNGNFVEYAALNPGQSYVQPTVVGHPWMITDGPGNCLEIYAPTAGASTFRLTASGAFGPE